MYRFIVNMNMLDVLILGYSATKDEIEMLAFGTRDRGGYRIMRGRCSSWSPIGARVSSSTRNIKNKYFFTNDYAEGEGGPDPRLATNIQEDAAGVQNYSVSLHR